jgi:trans-2,3-dihydro-3-hydroxyanthranilate isomerase
MPYRYLIVDVFTDRPLTGNPLAVVLDADPLSDAAMQAIAGEFNLSETVFVGGGAGGSGPRTARIFTPAAEIPFAGHPTIGAAVVVASLEGSAGDEEEERELTLVEQVGPVRCRVRAQRLGVGSASFELPEPARFGSAAPPAPEGLARLLRVDEGDVGFGDHVPAVVGAGFEFMFVPLAHVDVLARVEVATERWGEVLPEPLPKSLAAYAPEDDTGRAYRLRVFAPPLGIAEDPATGSAAAAFSGVIEAFGKLADGSHEIALRQGVEMGRPSRLSLEVRLGGGRVESGRVGGRVVLVADGTLHV